MNENVANNIKRWVPLVGGGALLACTAVFLFRKVKGAAEDKAFRGQWRLPEGARLARPGVEDRVDEAAVESFPASDPPSFTPARVG